MVRTKQRKTRNCNPSISYPCGNSCITQKYNCRKKLKGQAGTYADWLEIQALKLPKKRTSTARLSRSTKPSRSRGDTISPLTLQERSQPDKLIEVGKAFVAKYDLDNLQGKIKAYELKGEKHHDADQKRIAKIQVKIDKLQNEALKLGRLAFDAGQEGDADRMDELFKQQDLINQKLQLPEYDTSRRFFDKAEEANYKLFNLPKDRNIERLYRNNPDKIAAEKKRIAQQRKELEAQREKAIADRPGNKEFSLILQDVKQNSPLSLAQAKKVFAEQATFVEQESTKKYKKLITQDLSEAIQLMGDPPGELRIFRDKDRAYAENYFSTGWISSNDSVKPPVENNGVGINVGDEYEMNFRAKSVMLHEYGHSLEYRHQEIAIANQQWIKNRSTSDKPEQLNKLTGKTTYTDDEIAYPDKFVDPYVGKTYEGSIRQYEATEVFTVGVQHFTDAQNMKKFFEKDPEHFYLTLGSIIEIQNKNR